MLAIIISGFFTLLTRSIFLIKVPFERDNQLINRGMQAVPSAMLIGLVIPFAFFENQVLVLNSIGLSIILTIPLVYISKKPGLGILCVLLFYGLVEYANTLFVR